MIDIENMTKEELQDYAKDLKEQVDNLKEEVDDLKFDNRELENENDRLEEDLSAFEEEQSKYDIKSDNLIWRLKLDNLYTPSIEKFLDEFMKFYNE